MKVRTGFVSNSSSASFIVKFSSDLDSKKIKSLVKRTGTRDYKLHLKDENEYSLEVYTTMFNDWMDISEWRLVRALSENRIEKTVLISITKTEEEYADANYETKFDHRIWEYEELDNDEKFQYSEKEREEIKKKQETVDKEYLEYLKTCNQKISEEETIELTKHLKR